ncbi:hypothetical protein BOVA604_3962 [Bacteroides ovatus]|nr:hypothetical protein BOVAC1_118 [Bacteroides ovatus]CAG9899967.1 hypothetical protein BOVA604_3962 [Bacteroides ovatus]
MQQIAQGKNYENQDIIAKADYRIWIKSVDMLLSSIRYDL